ncbi:hypothetical protein O6H91_01G077500 [Diphasiastrum complanatum]|uniref:Uncharacterized protein n=1 Tax=Diphasiastrum complanatum TaxID=34168 RepID=A0ACC2ESD8_DIPCM|nr:hypothetical protein O6H91_01G077500 [Diphasiastrum complanatum]
MGAGTGGKTNVDSKCLSWQAAFQQAEAEFRLEVAAQEDFKEQLSYLEEGRNYLDLRSGEGFSIGIQSTSPTDPLADQLLPSKGEGVVDNVLVTLEYGDHVEDSMVTGQHDPVRKESDSSGVHVGSKGQSYSRRNRLRSNRYGNGHISPKAMEKVLGGVDPAIMYTSLQECAFSSDVQDMHENEACISTRFHIVSTKDQHVSSQYENGSGDVTKEEKSGSLNGLHIATEYQTSKNMSLAEVSFELGSDLKNVRHNTACAPLLQGPEGRNISSGDINAVHCASINSSNSDYFPYTGIHTFNANQATVETRKMDQDKLEKLPVSTICAKRACEQSIIHSGCKASTENTTVEKLSVNADGTDGCLITPQGNVENMKAIPDPKVPNFDENSRVMALSNSYSETAELLQVVKTIKDVAVDHNESLSRNGVQASQDDLQFGAEIVQVKLEDNPSNDNMSDLSASGETCRLKDTNGLLKSVGQEAGTLQASLQSTSTIHRGASRRLSSTASSTINKFHGVILPWQKEKNPKVASEAEKLKVSISLAARKAHKDIILEDAEAIKVSQKHTAEWGSRKAAPEHSRRKTHWDLVLEEMAWMANDFMQERLWKTAAAVQVCQRVAQDRCLVHYDTTALEKQQRIISSGLAKCVMKYWQLAESMLLRESCEESHRLNDADTGGTSEAVPMDVDNLTLRMAATIEQNDKYKTSSSLQDYAHRFLLSSLGKDLISKATGPLTPRRVSGDVVLHNSCERLCPKENLFYIAPQGASELYRISAESDWAAIEAEHEQTMQEQAAAFAEAEAQATIMGSGSGLPSFVDEIRSFIIQSSTRTGLTGEGDELEFQCLSGNLNTSVGANMLISKKKRQQMPKVGMPSEGSSLAAPDTFTSLPSLHVNGKRSFNSSFDPNTMSVGNIPTKRMRTAAITARQRASGSATPPISNAGITDVVYREKTLTRTFNSQKEDFLGVFDDSVLVRTAEAEISPNSSILGSSSYGTYNAPKLKKKKKIKQLHAGLPLSSIVDGAAHLYSAEKAMNSDYTWQQEVHQEHEQNEQLKRKGDQILQMSSNNSMSDGGFESVIEMPGTPGSQGAAVGQQPSKKVRLAKQCSDGNPDGVSTIRAAQTSPNNILRQNFVRDQLRKTKASKAPLLQASTTQAGAGIPWSMIEDQAIIALVHDLGPNWELVSDVLSMSSQLKGVFRKPKDCKERHKVLLEHLSTDDGDSPDDFTSPQGHPSALSGIPKSNSRMLLQRLQGPMEEHSLKIHLEQIVHLVLQDRARKHQIKHDSQEMQEILSVHISHANAVSQFNASSLTGGCFTPLDLCERTPLNGDIPTNAFAVQPANMSGIGFPALLAAGSDLRPSSAGLPFLPSLHMGPTLSASSMAMNAARDAQRMATATRPLSAEEQRLRYTQMVTGRGFPQGTSSPGNFSLMNLPHLSDCPVPILPTPNNGSMIGGRSRAMTLPRPGMQSMFPPGVSGMSSTGMNDVLPSGGVAMAGTAGSLMVGSIAGQFNLLRQSGDALQMVQSGQCTEEQRQMLIQELQHHAAQGNTNAAAALNSLSGNVPSTIVSSPKQGYMVQQQHNTLAQHPQNANQAYIAAVRMAKERQLQQHQEQQKRILQQQQLHQPNLIQPQPPLAQQQHVVTQQLQMQPQSQQLFLQQQQLQQQSAGPGIPSSTLQQQPPQTLVPQTLHIAEPQQHSISQPQQPQTLGQIGQLSSQPKLPQQKQLQRHQLQQQFLPTKGPKGAGRSGAMVLPVLPPQPGRSNLLTGQGMANQQSTQMPQIPHQMQGQRALSAAGPVQLPNQLNASQHGNAGHAVQLQGQAQGQVHANVLTPNTAVVAQQPKGLLLQPQPPLKQQQTQLPLQPPPSTSAIQLQQQPLPSSLLLPQQQSQLPPVSIPMLPQSPPPQSPQYQLRRQTQQPQPPHRRLQQRQISSSTGLQIATTMGKNSFQQPTPVSSRAVSNSGPLPFNMATAATGPSITGLTAPSVPLSSTISSTVSTQSTTWKSGQGFSPMSACAAGVYNLTRSHNPSTNQLSPSPQSLAGHHAVPNSAAISQRSVPPGTIVGSVPISGPGIISIQVPVASAVADSTVATSPTSLRTLVLKNYGKEGLVCLPA